MAQRNHAVYYNTFCLKAWLNSPHLHSWHSNSPNNKPGAEEGTRTLTGLLPTDFKSVASAYSATSARHPFHYKGAQAPLTGPALGFHFGGDGRIRTADRGFADPRLNHLATSPWSGRRDSNPRPSPWQGDALPLSHFRLYVVLLRLVPRRRFELLRAFAHCPLKTACLPIPPPRQADCLPSLDPSSLRRSCDYHITFSPGFSNGRSGRTRTPDLRFWRPLLFQLSYTPTGALQHPILPPPPKSRQFPPIYPSFPIGVGNPSPVVAAHAEPRRSMS